MGAGTTSFYSDDGLGSVRALTNGAGSVTDRYAYDAFGSALATTGSTANAYRFTGAQQDAALGMYYLRARYYQPSSGRFWTRDTWALDPQNPREWNRYVYVAADPVNGVDPSGYVALGEYGAANNETSKGAREYHAYRTGVELPKELTARELGKELATSARHINNQLRSELTKQFGKKAADNYMKRVTVGTARIRGEQYYSLNSGAPKQVVELMRSWHGESFVQSGDAHAEQALYLKARELVGSGVEVVAEQMPAIGVSHTGGPCAAVCQPFFANSQVEIYWMGHISRVFANLAVGL